MPIQKPKKPSNLVPRAFGGVKNNFSDDLQSTGFEPNIPQTYNGDNLNYHLDATGKELDYVEKVVDYINDMPVGNALYVNPNNQLDYVEVGEFANKADKDLSNTGMITNCLLEIPQNIKYTFVDGTFTLLKGSILTFPQGTTNLSSTYPVGSNYINSNFKVVGNSYIGNKFFVWAETQKDISISAVGSVTVVDNTLYVNASNSLFSFNGDGAVRSGDTQPTSGQYWYDTANNVINTSSNNFSSYSKVEGSLPICKFSRVNGVITEITQVFNGFGYVGSHLWVDKGVKVLIPDGRNEDGTLKNTEYTTTAIRLTARTGNTGTNGNIFLFNDGSLYITADNNPYYEQEEKPNIPINEYARWFNTKENLQYTKVPNEDFVVYAKPYASIGKITSTDGVLSNLQIKQSFKAVDYNDFEEKTSYLEQNSLNKQQITNCMLEVPQNINLTLDSGTLTLKKGSKLIVPNGAGVFEEFITPSDLVVHPATSTASDTRMIFITTNPFALAFRHAPKECHSGTTAPTNVTTTACWYDTANNIIKLTSDKGSTWTSDTKYALPLGIYTRTNGVGVSSLDQVFNGMGYIGSTVWVDKDVKVLIPNGRNQDGTLNNIEFVKTSVSITQVTEKSRRVAIFMSNTGVVSKWGADNNNVTQYKTRPAVPEKTFVKAYIEDENIWWYADNTGGWVTVQHIVPIFEVNTDSNAVITSANLKKPFRAVDYNEFANTPHIVETYQNGTSWYRVYSDGWIEQGGKSTTGNTVTLLKSYSNSNYTCVGIPNEETHGNYENLCIINRTESSFKGWLASYSYDFDWYACGY